MTGAAVGHRQANLAGGGGRTGHDLEAAAGFVVPYGVFDEVAGQPAE